MRQVIQVLQKDEARAVVRNREGEARLRDRYRELSKAIPDYQRSHKISISGGRKEAVPQRGPIQCDFSQ